MQNFISPLQNPCFSWRGIHTFEICRSHWYFPSFVGAGGIKNQCKQGRSPPGVFNYKVRGSKAPQYWFSFFSPKFQGASMAGDQILCRWEGLRLYLVGWDPHWALRIFICIEDQLNLGLEMSHFQQDCPQISLHTTAALCTCRFCFCPSPLSNNLLSIRAFLKGKCCSCSHFLPFPVCFLEQQILWDTKGLKSHWSVLSPQILQTGFAPLWGTTPGSASPLSVPLAGPFHHFIPKTNYPVFILKYVLCGGQSTKRTWREWMRSLGNLGGGIPGFWTPLWAQHPSEIGIREVTDHRTHSAIKF